MCGYLQKESVRLIFVYLYEGSDKAIERINDTLLTPVICQQIGVRTPIAYIQEMSVVLLPSLIANCQILI